MRALWLFAAVVVVWALPITGQAQEPNVDEEEEEDRYVTCNLSGDPELSTFTLQRGTVPFPCYSHLADIRLEVPDDSLAKVIMGFDFFIVDVYASADIKTFNGRYFVDKVMIEIGGYSYKEATDQFTLMLKGRYKTSSSNVETFLNSGQTPQDEANIWDIHAAIPGNVRTGYDNGEKWAFLNLLTDNNLLLQIGFRPRNPNEGIPQTPRPGVFIKARKGPMKGHLEARFPDTLCSTKNDDRTFKEIKDLNRYGGRLETNRQLMLYTVYSQNVLQIEPKCNDALDAFGNCVGEAKKQQAINICSPLTTATKVRCLESLESEPGNALEAFTQCVNVCCDVDKFNSQEWLILAAASCPVLYDDDLSSLWLHSVFPPHPRPQIIG